jgi:hypothetical protein
MEKKLVSLGLLPELESRSPEYLETLHRWGNLPHVVPVEDTARLLAKLCGQDADALFDVLTKAIERLELRAWGRSHDSEREWIEGMFRAFYEPDDFNLELDGPAGQETATLTLKKGAAGRMHWEYMGICPGDAVRLLQARKLKVPEELSSLLPTAANDEVTSINESRPGSAANEPAKTPLQRSAVQDQRILQLLRDRGYDPLHLPDRPKVGKGPKALVKLEAVKDRALFTDKSFEKAWERLRERQEIQGAK